MGEGFDLEISIDVGQVGLGFVLLVFHSVFVHP